MPKKLGGLKVCPKVHGRQNLYNFLEHSGTIMHLNRDQKVLGSSPTLAGSTIHVHAKFKFNVERCVVTLKKNLNLKKGGKGRKTALRRIFKGNLSTRSSGAF